MFCSVEPRSKTVAPDWSSSAESVVIIAIIGYENPTIFDDMLQMGATGVMTSPIRASGVLAALVMTLGQHREMEVLRKRITRLEQKISSAKHIDDAKAVLIRTRGVSDSEAYRILRDQAMSKRIAIEDIARAVIRANELLSG